MSLKRLVDAAFIACFSLQLWCYREDANHTENASKYGLFFLTDVRRYFVRMRVYVTLTDSGRKYSGQVIRVEKPQM